jgi:PleD family two-component response regulator
MSRVRASKVCRLRANSRRIRSCGRHDAWHYGVQVLERLRVAHAHLPIVLLTATDAAADQVKGVGLGADDYIITAHNDRSGGGSRS